MGKAACQQRDARLVADGQFAGRVAVGIEREAVRGGWFTLTASFLSPELESWAGVYLTFVPTFTILPVTQSPPSN